MVSDYTSKISTDFVIVPSTYYMNINVIANMQHSKKRLFPKGNRRFSTLRSFISDPRILVISVAKSQKSPVMIHRVHRLD